MLSMEKANAKKHGIILNWQMPIIIWGRGQCMDGRFVHYTDDVCLHTVIFFGQDYITTFPPTQKYFFSIFCEMCISVCRMGRCCILTHLSQYALLCSCPL